MERQFRPGHAKVMPGGTMFRWEQGTKTHRGDGQDVITKWSFDGGETWQMVRMEDLIVAAASLCENEDHLYDKPYHEGGAMLVRFLKRVRCDPVRDILTDLWEGRFWAAHRDGGGDPADQWRAPDD